MTNTTATINPAMTELAEEIAGLSPREADVFEAGAISIINIFRESALDVAADVRRQAAEAGLSDAEAREAFDYFFDPLTDLIDQRSTVLREAVRKAQGVTVPSPEALIEGLLTALLGEEAAAEALADEPAEARIVEDEPEAVADVSFEQFFEEVFGFKPTTV